MGDSFHVVFGDLISNLCGLIFLGLWDVGLLFSTFVTGSPETYSMLSELFFILWTAYSYDLDACAWGFVALPLFSVFDRGFDFETVS